MPAAPSAPAPVSRASAGAGSPDGGPRAATPLPAAGPARADWKRELATAFRHPRDLLHHLGLGDQTGIASDEAARELPMLVPRGFAALMRAGDADDPLLRQVLPRPAELLHPAHYVLDPVGDAAACRVPGLLQKYAGRALLLPTGACAVHCRYCFRRHFPYADHSSGGRLESALRELAACPDLREVILSGGDPLMLDDDALAALIGRLRRVPHLRRLRLHSRLPIVLPSRVTPALRRLLGAHGRRTMVVVHANHPAELGPQAADALALLAGDGIPLLNQSVLLQGVNDDVAVLAELAERLFDLGVSNYYLHQLDRVRGAAHFEVDDRRARALMDGLRSVLPGYLVPRLVREQPGAPSKTPVS